MKTKLIFVIDDDRLEKYLRSELLLEKLSLEENGCEKIDEILEKLGKEDIEFNIQTPHVDSNSKADIENCVCENDEEADNFAEDFAQEMSYLIREFCIEENVD